eukprot:EC714386.1.p3 GENE.EC714386.1~~EC714386.1.p3  ORF type:complete len:63 (+),score=8.88 EC714386.1:148-336(+)
MIPLCDAIRTRTPMPSHIEKAIYQTADSALPEHPLRMPEGGDLTVLGVPPAEGDATTSSSQA